MDGHTIFRLGFIVTFSPDDTGNGTVSIGRRDIYYLGTANGYGTHVASFRMKSRAPGEASNNLLSLAVQKHSDRKGQSKALEGIDQGMFVQ